jgi:hypothetical protein
VQRVSAPATGVTPYQTATVQSVAPALPAAGSCPKDAPLPDRPRIVRPSPAAERPKDRVTGIVSEISYGIIIVLLHNSFSAADRRTLRDSRLPALRAAAARAARWRHSFDGTDVAWRVRPGLFVVDRSGCGKEGSATAPMATPMSCGMHSGPKQRRPALWAEVKRQQLFPRPNCMTLTAPRSKRRQCRTRFPSGAGNRRSDTPRRAWVLSDSGAVAVHRRSWRDVGPWVLHS